ncbi:MAG: DUF4124 domain-containing protein [Gammaproteobacteria bacterium]|nr:MAG: DUF4124 domain-containing protein [Gammaproteobacteria bacterium]
MSITTIVFIVILLFFTWRGYQKGFIGAISRILSFVIAYPAAIFFTKPFAAFLRGFIAIDGLLLFLIAGCTIFFVVSLAVTLLLNAISDLVPRSQLTETSSKIGGAAFGLVIGSVFGLIAVYVIDIFIKPKTVLIATQESRSAKQNTNEEAESIKKYVVAEDAPIKGTFIDVTAKKLVSAAASTAVGIATDDKTASQITKTITQDPQVMLTHVQNMTNDGEFKELLNKPDFQAQLNRGNTDELMRNKDFQKIIQNPDMQAIIASSGDGNGSEIENEADEKAAAEKMVQAWQKVSTLKNDPRVIAIVSDEAFQAQLNSPNKLPLLMNPKLRELSEIIFSKDARTVTSESFETADTKKSNVHYTVEDITHGNKRVTESGNSSSQAEQVEEKLYRWTDENGKVHYSDKSIKAKP